MGRHNPLHTPNEVKVIRRIITRELGKESVKNMLCHTDLGLAEIIRRETNLTISQQLVRYHRQQTNIDGHPTRLRMLIRQSRKEYGKRPIKKQSNRR